MSGTGVVLLLLVVEVYASSNPVIDLSHWNREPDFAAVKSDGVVAIIHKATQGTTYSDNTYSNRQILAGKQGILWGAYHFGVGGKSGADQANHLLRVVGDPSKVLLALDLEPNHSGQNMTVAEAEEFVARVKERTGRYPLLYGSPYFLDHYNTAALRRCNLWVAQYTIKDSPRLPNGWTSWSLWQYTDGRTGGSPRTVKGVGSCDRDRYHGTVEQLRSKWPNI